MAPLPNARLLEACRVLFGREFEASFLDLLREPGVRVAYRHRALATHPDRVTDETLKRIRTERFIEAQRAYALLREYVRHRQGDPPGRRASGGSSRSADRPAGAPTDRRARQEPHSRPRGPAPGLPSRRLRLGEFLCLSRAISFPALIDALVRQRSQRPRFGDITLRWRYLGEAEVRMLLESRRPLERLGEAARRLGLLTDFQVRTVVWFQRRLQHRLGEVVVEAGHLHPGRLEELIHRLEAHNAAFPPLP